MVKPEELSELLSDIGDAAIDAARWPDTLAKAAKFVGGCSAALYFKDAYSASGHVQFDDGYLSDAYKQLYFAQYVRSDPTTVLHFCFEPGDVAATADLMDYDEFRQSRFYLEWAKPQALADLVAVILDKSSTGMSMFGVFRSDANGQADEEAKRRLRLIVPHLRRASAVAKTLGMRVAVASAFEAVIDGLPSAVALVDPMARLVHANRTACAMLAGAGPLTLRDMVIATTDARASRELRQLIAAISHEAHAAAADAVLLIDTVGCRWLLNVLPLPAHSAATAAVFVSRVDFVTPEPPQLIARAYRLTPTELRILLSIVATGSIPETGEALGIAQTTVKWHLRKVFAKTGTTRQAELIKLVSGFTSPILR